MKRRKIISRALGYCLMIAQASCLAGCGEWQTQTVPDEAVIELIEPTAELSGSETVTRRNLYTAKVYEVLVDPYIEDYSYEETRNYLGTDWKIGDMVGEGNIIYKANILSLEPQIERLTEKLTELEESYAEYYYDIRTKLNDQYWELSMLEWELGEVQDTEPEDKSSAAYAAWEKEEHEVTGCADTENSDFCLPSVA